MMEWPMMSHSQDLGSLQSYVRYLRYAVATTTCRSTVDVLQQMLQDAKGRLSTQRMNASDAKPL
jgi:hypothetical protein